MIYPGGPAEPDTLRVAIVAAAAAVIVVIMLLKSADD